MPDFAVKTAFTATDKISPAFKKMGKSADVFGRKATGAFARANAGIKKLWGSMKTFGTMGLAMGAGIIVKDFVELDDAVYGATARFMAAEKAGTKIEDVMKKIRKAAQDTGAATQFTSAEAAKGLDKFALAGFTSTEAIKSLKSVIDLTTVTGEEFSRVSDISTDLLGAFGGAALKSADKIAKLKQMNSLLAVGTLSANVTMEDLFETLKQAAPIGTQLGMSMKDVIATTSVLGSAGIKGSMAATAMKNIFLRLVKPTKEVRSALADLNLSQRDFVNAQGGLKSTAEIFGLIGKRTKGMEKVKVAQLFASLAGLRGTAGASVIAQNISEINKQMIRMGKDPQKAMKETADLMRKSLGNRLKILWSVVSSLGEAFLNAFGKTPGDAIGKLSDSLKSLRPVFSAVGKTVAYLAGWIPTLVKWFVAYKVAVMAVTIAQKIQLALGWLKYLWMMREFLKASTIAQYALNLAMKLNPIGLVIVAVTALGAALYDMYKNWDKYSLRIRIKMQEWILQWKALKLEVLRALNVIGLVNKKSVEAADKEGFQAYKKGVEMTQEYNALVAPNKSKSKGNKLDISGNIQVEGAKTVNTTTMIDGRKSNKKLLGQN